MIKSKDKYTMYTIYIYLYILIYTIYINDIKSKNKY